MARIAGVDLPKKKRGCISLTYIYGIGRTKALNILDKVGVDPNTQVNDLSLIHISEPTRLLSISYAVFCLKKKT